jgi:hypothetical protein
MISRFLVFLSMIFILSDCNIRKPKNSKRDKCIQSFLIKYSQNENLYYTPSKDYEFRFSCTSDIDFQAPTCTEYYSKVRLDENFICPVGYKRKSSKCSQQNLLGVCHETERIGSNATAQVKVSVFSEPYNTREEGKLYCASADRNGNFFNSYRDPTNTKTIEKEQIDALIFCIGLVEK